MWAVYNINNSGLLNNNINSLAIDNQDFLWIGTDGGLFIYNGNYWTSYTTSNSNLPSNMVKALAIDNLQNIWIGTYN